jgi:peptidoglycan/LPS O-acetylase OafA/YrhL
MRFLSVVAMISYSFFILHPYMIDNQLARKVLTKLALTGGGSILVHYAVSIVLCFFVSTISYYYLERSYFKSYKGERHQIISN